MSSTNVKDCISHDWDYILLGDGRTCKNCKIVEVKQWSRCR